MGSHAHDCDRGAMRVGFGVTRADLHDAPIAGSAALTGTSPARNVRPGVVPHGVGRCTSTGSAAPCLYGHSVVRCGLAVVWSVGAGMNVKRSYTPTTPVVPA